MVGEACGDQAIGIWDQSDTGKPRALVTGKQGFIRTEGRATDLEGHIAGKRRVAPRPALLRMPGSRDSLGTPLSSPAVPNSASGFPSSGLCPDNSKSWKPASWKSPASRPAGKQQRGPGECSSGDRGPPSQRHRNRCWGRIVLGNRPSAGFCLASGVGEDLCFTKQHLTPLGV